jgi:AAA15 family ATPase/GTPase
LKLALIYGPNASGKTMILEALDFLRLLVLKPKKTKTDRLYFEPFLFDIDTPGKASLLSIEFLQEGIKYFYEVEFIKTAILREELFFYEPKRANLYRRTTNLEEQYTSITFGSKIKIAKSVKEALETNTLWNNTVLGGFLKTNIKFKELQPVIEWFKRSLAPMVASKTILAQFVTRNINVGKIKKADMIEQLTKADIHISDIVITEEDITVPEHIIEYIKKDHPNVKSEDLPEKNTKIKSLELVMEHTVNQNKYSLPFDVESDGTQRYYGLSGLLSLLFHRSMVLPIDELESSLHPDLYEHFLLSFLLNAKDSQVIATTHNRELLDKKDFFRNDVIWFTDKDQNCATQLYSLADFDSSVVRDTTNVRNAYKSGKFGATPRIGDAYIDLNQ